MSRKNKVNPGQYTQAGRLAPDDAARERVKQDSSVSDQRRGSGQKTVPADGENEQTSSKSGSRSGAQKAADSKYVNQPQPASGKVDGAFGRESGH